MAAQLQTAALPYMRALPPPQLHRHRRKQRACMHSKVACSSYTGTGSRGLQLQEAVLTAKDLHALYGYLLQPHECSKQP